MNEETEMQRGWLAYPRPTTDKWPTWGLIPPLAWIQELCGVPAQNDKMLPFWPNEKVLPFVACAALGGSWGFWRACLHPHPLQSSFFQETQLHMLLFLVESLLCLGRWPCRRMLRTWLGSALEEEPSTVPACILFRYWVLWRWEGGAGGGKPPPYLDMTKVHSSTL